MATEELRNMVDAHGKIEQERGELNEKASKLNYDVTKILVESKIYDAFSINWSLLRRMTR